MRTIRVKADKKIIDYCNELLQEICFDDDSKEMLDKIEKLNARQDDYIGLFEIDINDKYSLTIDLCSGDSNYYDNIVIWQKNGNYYNEIDYLDCDFEIGNDIILEKEYFDFLDNDYKIVFDM